MDLEGDRTRANDIPVLRAGFSVVSWAKVNGDSRESEDIVLGPWWSRRIIENRLEEAQDIHNEHDSNNYIVSIDDCDGMES